MRSTASSVSNLSSAGGTYPGNSNRCTSLRQHKSHQRLPPDILRTTGGACSANSLHGGGVQGSLHRLFVDGNERRLRVDGWIYRYMLNLREGGGPPHGLLQQRRTFATTTWGTRAHRKGGARAVVVHDRVVIRHKAELDRHPAARRDKPRRPRGWAAPATRPLA